MSFAAAIAEPTTTAYSDSRPLNSDCYYHNNWRAIVAARPGTEDMLAFALLADEAVYEFVTFSLKRLLQAAPSRQRENEIDQVLCLAETLLACGKN